MKLNIDHLTESELIELNHKIVERLRLMRQIRSHKEMFKFKIGDRVSFHPSGHEPQAGTLTRFNRKSVTVITDNGGHWNVAPTLIELAEPKGPEAETEMPQLKLLK
ncbi:MAG: hypothetical protein HY696_04750 [Deltaproteobacteria bacterium]|nr:hypothetical protein [Deltaproteobacteria bacterium]